MIRNLSVRGRVVLSSYFALLAAAISIVIGVVGIIKISRSQRHLKGLILVVLGIGCACIAATISVAELIRMQQWSIATECGHRHLKIEAAKEQWALETKQCQGAKVTKRDVMAYTPTAWSELPKDEDGFVPCPG